MNSPTLLHFYYGRNAIYYTLNLLKVSENDEILTPAWDCDETLQPFRKKKCKVVFYRSDPKTFEVNLEDLLSRITGKTKLIHIINHFGHVQDWSKILNGLKPFNIPIIEDNAYTFGSKHRNSNVGTFGDFSIFSYRKVLPVSNGADLLINRNFATNGEIRLPKFYKNELKRIPFFILDLFNQELGNLARWYLLYRRMSIPNQNYNFPLCSNSKEKLPLLKRESISNYFNDNLLKPSSLLSTMFVKYYSKIYFSRTAFVRKKNYSILSEGLAGINGIEIINPYLGLDIIPTAFSMLVETNRDQLFYQLRIQGIPVFVWPALSVEVLDYLDEFPEIRILGQKLLQIWLSNGHKHDYRVFVDKIRNTFALR